MIEFAMVIWFTIRCVTLWRIIRVAEWSVGDHKFAVGSHRLGRKFK
jgi:hypothetical protein